MNDKSVRLGRRAAEFSLDCLRDGVRLAREEYGLPRSTDSRVLGWIGGFLGSYLALSQRLLRNYEDADELPGPVTDLCAGLQELRSFFYGRPLREVGDALYDLALKGRSPPGQESIIKELDRGRERVAGAARRLGVQYVARSADWLHPRDGRRAA